MSEENKDETTEAARELPTFTVRRFDVEEEMDPLVGLVPFLEEEGH